MFRNKTLLSTLSFLCLLFGLAGAAHARSAVADVFPTAETDPGKKKIGVVLFTDTPNGLAISVSLKGLPPGKRGFHIHEVGDCGPTTKDGNVIPAGAAGGHWDPDKTGKHMGPGGSGHKGDLPPLEVAEDGTVETTLHVKNITVDDIKNLAVIIHAGGDNFSDEPAPLGGGGPRFACGVIK